MKHFINIVTKSPLKNGSMSMNADNKHPAHLF